MRIVRKVFKARFLKPFEGYVMDKGFNGMIIVVCVAIAISAIAFFTYEPKVPDAPTPPPPEPPAAPPAPPPLQLPDVEPDEPTVRVVELLGNADKRVKALEYHYRGPPDPSVVPMYTVKGSLVRIDLDPEMTISLEDFFDTVFINADTQSAVAYCRDVSHIRCPDKEKAYIVEFEDYYQKTPYQWLKMLTKPVESGEEFYQSRNVVILQETLDDIPTRMWVDVFYGLPLKLEQTINGEVVRTYFDELRVYAVSEEDVTP